MARKFMTKKIANEQAEKLRGMVTDGVTVEAKSSIVSVSYRDDYNVGCQIDTATLHGIGEIIAILDDLELIKGEK